MYTVHKKENWKIEKKNTEIPKELFTNKPNKLSFRNVLEECMFVQIYPHS